jgi:hypothetical protein
MLRNTAYSITVVLQWYDSGVAVMLQWRYSGMCTLQCSATQPGSCGDGNGGGGDGYVHMNTHIL